MTTYWDTSAAINAAISPEVFRRLENGKHVARLHLLAEFFATMTGRGVEIKDEAEILTGWFSRKTLAPPG